MSNISPVNFQKDGRTPAQIARDILNTPLDSAGRETFGKWLADPIDERNDQSLDAREYSKLCEQTYNIPRLDWLGEKLKRDLQSIADETYASDQGIAPVLNQALRICHALHSVTLNVARDNIRITKESEKDTGTRDDLQRKDAGEHIFQVRQLNKIRADFKTLGNLLDINYVDANLGNSR